MIKKIYMIFLIFIFAIFLRIQCIRTNETFADLFYFPTIIYWHFFLSFFILIIEIDLKDFKKAGQINDQLSFLVCYSNCSSSVNFSSNTLSASSIGFLLVISTPAFFRYFNWIIRATCF